MKRVCAKCEVEFKPEVTGVIVYEMMNHNKEIYKIWHADLWKCPICGAEIIVGFGEPINKPAHEHYKDDCEAQLEKYKAKGYRIYKDKELPL